VKSGAMGSADQVRGSLRNPLSRGSQREARGERSGQAGGRRLSCGCRRGSCHDRVAFMLFAALLKSIVHTGRLRLIDAAGRRHEIGDGTPPAATIRLGSRRVDLQLAVNPALHVGEAYMNGELTIEAGTLYDFLAVCAQNYDNLLRNPWFSFVHKAARGIKQYNPVGRAQRNVAHHYDLSDKLYDLFLDKDRQYS